jgi:hypothetical protein
MDQYSWLVAEIMVRQRARELASQPRALPEPPGPGRAGLRRTLASAMVRLGLRLDPTAGERLAAAFAFASEGRR